MRLFQIIHLCIAFTFLSYWIGQPFVSETLMIRQNEIFYLNITGNNFWNGLSEEVKSSLTSHYTAIKENTAPFSKKFLNIFHVFWGYPIPMQLWFLLSLSLPIGVLLSNPKAKKALIILPLLTISTLFYPVHPPVNHPVYPEEKELYPYLTEPLFKSITIQKRQLEQAFESYLIAKYPDCEQYGDEKLEFAKFKFLIKQFLNQDFDTPTNPHPLAILLTLWTLVYVSGTYILEAGALLRIDQKRRDHFDIS